MRFLTFFCVAATLVVVSFAEPALQKDAIIQGASGVVGQVKQPPVAGKKAKGKK